MSRFGDLISGKPAAPKPAPAPKPEPKPAPAPKPAPEPAPVVEEKGWGEG